MKKLIKKERCPLCGAKAFYREIKPSAYTYKGHSITVQQPGSWCDSCKDGVLGPKDVKATREELQAFQSRIDGLLVPAEIYRVRKKILNLTQNQAAHIFGGGPNAFSRYENGEMAPSRSLSNLLRILAKHPDLLNELKKYGGNERPPSASAA